MAETLTLRRALRRGEERLAAAGISDARMEARLLLEHALGTNTARLYLQLEEALAEDGMARFLRALERRARREPLAYVTGHVEFYSLDLLVDHRVMVPRPETETLVDAALAWARERTSPLLAADIGTGSGCMAIALAASHPSLRF